MLKKYGSITSSSAMMWLVGLLRDLLLQSHWSNHSTVCHDEQVKYWLTGSSNSGAASISGSSGIIGSSAHSSSSCWSACIWSWASESSPLHAQPFLPGHALVQTSFQLWHCCHDSDCLKDQVQTRTIHPKTRAQVLGDASENEHDWI